MAAFCHFELFLIDNSILTINQATLVLPIISSEEVPKSSIGSAFSPYVNTKNNKRLSS